MNFVLHPWHIVLLTASRNFNDTGADDYLRGTAEYNGDWRVFVGYRNKSGLKRSRIAWGAFFVRLDEYFRIGYVYRI